MDEGKGFEPSRRRLEKARKEGKVLKSPLIAQSVLVIGCFLTFFLWVRLSWVRIQILLEYLLTTGATEPQACLRESLTIFLEAVLTCLIPSCVAAVAVDGLQAGFRIDARILKPELSRFSIGQGLRGIMAGAGQVWQPVLRLVLFAALPLWVLHSGAGFWTTLDAVHDRALVLEGFAAELLAIMIIGGAVMALSAGADYLMRRRRFVRELSMSAAEVRQEYREEEGDPLMKATRKAMHESLLMQDLVQRVRKSRVIVVERN